MPKIDFRPLNSTPLILTRVETQQKLFVSHDSNSAVQKKAVLFSKESSFVLITMARLRVTKSLYPTSRHHALTLQHFPRISALYKFEWMLCYLLSCYVAMTMTIDTKSGNCDNEEDDEERMNGKTESKM